MFSRAVFFSGAIRTFASRSTLVGIPHEAHPKEVLTSLYQKILHDVAEIPESAIYRRNVEIVTKNRLKALSEAPSIEEFEKTVDAGVVDEVIVQAREELALVAQMKQWKPWETQAAASSK